MQSDRTIYLDHHASTPVDAAVLEAMIPWLSGSYGNAHSAEHAVGWAAADAIDGARARVADAIGAVPEEVVFTAGATEANNIAILGASAASQGQGAVVVSAIEHDSVLTIARSLAAVGRETRIVPVDADGFVRMGALADALSGETCLVSIGLVNSEIGVMQDLAAVAAMCRDRGVPLHTDATQGLAFDALDVESLGVDFASVSAHKIGGPQGVGALFVSSAATDLIAPVLHGGGQEGGLRPGTLPVALCVGFGVASRRLPDEREMEEWRGTTARLRCAMQAAFPGARLNGAGEPRHPGNLNMLLPGLDAEMLIARVQPAVALSRGSACTSGTPGPSHVLRALGLSVEEASCSVRLGTSRWTSDWEVDVAVEVLAKAARGLHC